MLKPDVMLFTMRKPSDGGATFLQGVRTLLFPEEHVAHVTDKVNAVSHSFDSIPKTCNKC